MKLHRNYECTAPQPGSASKNVIRASGIEALDDSVADFGEVGAAAEDHGAAAEAGAGEARAQRARVHGGLHQAVERRATDLQAVAQAGVGVEKDASEACGRSRLHGVDGAAHAEGLGDYVQEGGRQVSGCREARTVRPRFGRRSPRGRTRSPSRRSAALPAVRTAL